MAVTTFTWNGFRFHALNRLPAAVKPERAEDARSEATGALATALTGSHAYLLGSDETEPMLVTAWIRACGTSRLRVLLGGRPTFPPALGDAEPQVEPRPVLFPPGGTATDVSVARVAEALEQFPHWVPCSGRPDALWAPTGNQRPGPRARRGSFDRQVAHLREPFVWLVLARPLRAQDLQPELDLLVNEILPLSRGEVGEAKRIALERKQAQHRDLSRAQVGAAWRIRVLVGGMTEPAANSAAALLCAAAELEGLPYVVAPAGRPAAFPVAVRADVADAHGNRTAFAAGSELLAALTRPPERELPGIRLVEPHTFDVTSESASPEGLFLGTVLDASENDVGELRLSRDTLNRHTFVSGATGSGKSQTIRHLLTQATRAGIPWLVIEPAKAEYALMAARLADAGADVIVIRPGDPGSAPAGFNPLEPAAGFSVQTHIDLVRALFLASFEPHEPFPQILATALTRCYQELGWDLTLGRPAPDRCDPRWPTLADLQRVATTVTAEIGYSDKIAADVQGFIGVRIGSLRQGTPGRFFEGAHPLDFAHLLAGNVVLEIEDVGDDRDKAFLMGAVLLRMTEHLRERAKGERNRVPELRHLTVIEEAHRLLRRPESGTSGAAAHAVEMFAALLAEVRAYGEGLIIAEQIPATLVPDVIKNTATKILHRLPAVDDRETVGATMNLDEDQSRFVVTLRRGVAAVFTDETDRPLVVRVEDGTDGERAESAPVSPARIVRPRSPSCGRDCVIERCTLHQIRDAQHVLEHEPQLALWAELAVLAHLVGQDVPTPVRALATRWGPPHRSNRELDCALAEAVDDAIAVRSAALSAVTGPAELGRHVCAAMRARIVGADDVCASDELRYVCAPYQWAVIEQQLVNSLETVDRGPHPRTAEWESRYGRALPGETLTQQLAVLTSWADADFDDLSRRQAVIHGTRRPSRLEQQLGLGRSGAHYRVAAMAELLPGSEWITRFVEVPSPPSSRSGA